MKRPDIFSNLNLSGEGGGVRGKGRGEGRGTRGTTAFSTLSRSSRMGFLTWIRINCVILKLSVSEANVESSNFNLIL